MTSGTFTIPKVGEIDPNQFYRVTLTGSDSGGLTKSTSMDIKPRKSTFTLATNIAGLKLSLDSAAAKTAPFGTTGVVGMTRSIAAPASQTLNGKTYAFVSWSDDKSATHTIDIPAANTTFTASYREVSGGSTQSFRALSDATVRDGAFATQNFGSATTLGVKKGGGGFTRWTYLKFDLKNISAASIGKVVLRLFGKLDNTVTKNISIEVFSVASTSWTEGSITWNNKPASGTTAMGKLTVIDTAARWYEVDLTSYVKQQRTAGKIAVAFALKAAINAQPLAVFNADEAASNRPALLVTVPASPAPISSALWVGTLTSDRRDSAWEQLNRTIDVT